MHFVQILHIFCLFVFFNHTQFSFSPSTAPEKENEVRTQTIHCTDQAPKSRADYYLKFLYENSFGREFMKRDLMEETKQLKKKVFLFSSLVLTGGI